MSESLPNNESIESQDFIFLRKACEEADARVLDELFRRHYAKLYHAPSHTVGNLDIESLGGITGAAGMIIDQLESSFVESLELDTLEGREEFEVVKLALKSAMLVHDAVIEIDNLVEEDENADLNVEKTVKRRRGYVPGGNEYESAEFYKQNLDVDADNKYYNLFTRVLEDTVAGTDPNATGMLPVEADALAKLTTEEVRGCLADKETGSALILSLDSARANESLAALIGSTTDLIGAAFPEPFFETGNLEMFELYYQLSSDCADFLKNPSSLSRMRAVQILKVMTGWRKTQVGVALGQKIRLQKNFTPASVKGLFEVTFGKTPKDEEVQIFISKVASFSEGMDTSMSESVERYNQYLKFVIEPEGSSELDESEVTTLQKALEFVNADADQLRRYAEDVEREKVKNSQKT